MTCYPLYDILSQMGQTHIDYFSLDVEGHELAVLKTIPFKKLDITVIRFNIPNWLHISMIIIIGIECGIHSCR